MNEIFWLILILGILNFAILIANFVLIRKFNDFKDISDAWNKIASMRLLLQTMIRMEEHCNA